MIVLGQKEYTGKLLFMLGSILYKGVDGTIGSEWILGRECGLDSTVSG
jgi:hypothetical protein